MDHREVLEQLELAAVEPGGLERLMAGDTPAAAAVAGHLAGCDTCAGELERLRRAVPLLRDVVRTTPPADLRDRTLAFVRTRGVERGAGPGSTAKSAPGSAVSSVMTATPVPLATSAVAAVVAPGPVRRGRSVLPWVASIAAAVVISVVASTAFISGQVDQRQAAQDRAIAGLEAVTAATLEITADPDSRRVALEPVPGSTATGSLLFSPTSTRLVVVGTGLDAPPAGQEYRCWVLVGGARQDVGRMNVTDDLSYWVGVTPEVANVPPGTTFGVSLSDLDGSGVEFDPVMVGGL